MNFNGLPSVFIAEFLVGARPQGSIGPLKFVVLVMWSCLRQLFADWIEVWYYLNAQSAKYGGFIKNI